MENQTETIGIAGYGRFGRTLAELMQDGGISITAYDPRGRVPEAIEAADPADLVRRSTTVILAVPLPQLRQALQQIRPYLTRDHTVFDVGSVKIMPTQAMTEVLGDEMPWVATHPLFGPTSIAHGERPLRVVVCPNEFHPKAVERVTRLFRAIGCVTFHQGCEDHDRTMAYTHALTYFVTKGMLDIGIDNISEAPPSFRAMAVTIEAVRSDAGHLFSALHRQNPYAPEARQRLLEALKAADTVLSQKQAQIAIPVGLAHPSDGATDRNEELEQVRAGIDACDLELLALLERRARLSIRAGEAKAVRGRDVRDPDREQQLRVDRRAWATKLGLDDEAVDDVFCAIMRYSRRIQQCNRRDR